MSKKRQKTSLLWENGKVFKEIISSDPSNWHG